MSQVVIKDVYGGRKSEIARRLALVDGYYEKTTNSMRRGWNESFHFAAFAPGEKLADALRRNERDLAMEARFVPGARVLDIGCGIGGPALTIARHSGAHVVGVNIVMMQLEIARRRAARAGLAGLTEFVWADAGDLPFPDCSFDGAYTFDAMCHLQDKVAAYREIVRILKPGAVFLGQDWMMRPGLTPGDVERYIAPICENHCMPGLIATDVFSAILADADLKIEYQGALGDFGDIEPNWQLLDRKLVRALRQYLPAVLPSTMKMLIDGGHALLEGVRAGAFVISRWRARKTLRSSAC